MRNILLFFKDQFSIAFQSRKVCTGFCKPYFTRASPRARRDAAAKRRAEFIELARLFYCICLLLPAPKCSVKVVVIETFVKSSLLTRTLK